MIDPHIVGETLLFACYVFSIGGQAMIARKKRAGFAWNLVGNVSAIAAGYYLGVATMVAFSTVWLLTNVYGLVNWRESE